MEFVTETFCGDQFLVYTADKNGMPDMDGLTLLAQKDSPGLAALLLSPDRVMYNISGMVVLSKKLAGTVKKKTLLGVFLGIANAFLSVQALSLAADGILLDPEQIFTNPHSGKTELIYLPLVNGKSSVVTPRAFMKNLLFTSLFDQTEDCGYIAQLLNHLNQQSDFSPAELKALVERLMEDDPTKMPEAPEALYQTLLRGLENRSLHIPCPGVTQDTVNSILHQILLDHPQLCHFEGQWRWMDGVVPTYVLSREQQAELEPQCDAVLRQLWLIPGSRDARKIAEQVCRWLSENVVYDRSAPHNQSAYGALVDRKAVCKGIAKAFQLLLRKLGIPCVLVEGSLDGTTKHVWNMYLADRWVHCDVTMCYPQFSGWNLTGDPMGYLAMSTEDILRSHSIWSGDAPAGQEKRTAVFFQSLAGSYRQSPRAPLERLPQWLAQRYPGPLRYLGSGSVSDVYQAGADVVMKQIPCHLDSGKLYHALRECSILQRVRDCSGTAALLDFDVVRTAGGFTVFLVQKYYPSLDQHCSRTPITVASALRMAVDVCVGLEQLKNKGIAHLDIQPGNLLVAADGSVKLTDLSSALPVEELVRERQVRGTPAYMAPEVRSEQRYSESSEVYALGIVLYCLLHNGNLPFTNEYPLERAVEARHAGRPVTLSEAFDPELRACVEKACAFRAEDRFQTMEQFRAALEALLQAEPGPSRQVYLPQAPENTTWLPPDYWQADRIGTSVCLSTAFRSGVLCADTIGETTVLAAPEVREEGVQLSTVQFSALVPKTAIKGDYTIVQLFMYEQAFRSAVEEALQMAEVAMQEKKTGFYQVGDQTRVKVVLTSPDVEVPEDTAEGIWTGGYLTFDFALQIPADCTKRQTLLKFTVYFNDIPATRLMMTMQLQSMHAQRLELLRTDVLRAFVSYASQDRSRVGALVQGMIKARPDMDIFFDVNSLRSGDDWETTLRSEIETRDTLFLCWSENARKSPWVDKEWRYALKNKGIEAIEPIPIDPPEVCPPPEELKSKHFNDSLLYIINK